MPQELCLPPDRKATLDGLLEALKKQLGRNLRAVLAYGSAVRGDFVPGRSDINLLLLLEVSTPEAHRVTGECFQGRSEYDLFILGNQGLERSLQVFAIKFRSIKRNYCVLHGDDPLAQWQPDEKLLRFLCEQSLRNLRLRAKRSYILMLNSPVRYTQYIASVVPGLFSDLSEALRCADHELPKSREARIPLIEKELGPEAAILKRLLELRKQTKPMQAEEIHTVHAGVHRLLTRCLDWMTERWPNLPSP